MKQFIFICVAFFPLMYAHTLYVPVSHGELIDKITILEIKAVRITNKEQLIHIHKELDALQKVYDTFVYDHNIHRLTKALKGINSELWNIEDMLREKERTGIFDAEFIDLARKIYILNDKRHHYKKLISEQFDSHFVEQKSYAAY